MGDQVIFLGLDYITASVDVNSIKSLTSMNLTINIVDGDDSKNPGSKIDVDYDNAVVDINAVDGDGAALTLSDTTATLQNGTVIVANFQVTLPLGISTPTPITFLFATQATENTIKSTVNKDYNPSGLLDVEVFGERLGAIGYDVSLGDMYNAVRDGQANSTWEQVADFGAIAGDNNLIRTSTTNFLWLTLTGSTNLSSISTNNGASFGSFASTDLAETSLTNMNQAIAGLDGFVYVGTKESSGSLEASIYRSSNGVNWTRVLSVVVAGSTEGHFNQIEVLPNGRLVAIGQFISNNAVVVYTSDNGTSWIKRATIIPPNAWDFPGGIMKYNPTDSKIYALMVNRFFDIHSCYVISNNGTLMSILWHKISTTEPRNELNPYPQNAFGSGAWYVTSGNTSRSTNFGFTWSTLSGVGGKSVSHIDGKAYWLSGDEIYRSTLSSPFYELYQTMNTTIDLDVVKMEAPG